MFGVNPDYDTSCCFFTFFAERQKRKKAARGVGLVWRLLRVLCFDLTYLCNKDENRWNDEFFVSEDLIHRFPSVDEHTHGLGFDDCVTITCLNHRGLKQCRTEGIDIVYIKGENSLVWWKWVLAFLKEVTQWPHWKSLWPRSNKQKLSLFK